MDEIAARRSPCVTLPFADARRAGLDWLDARLSADAAQQGPARQAWNSGLLSFTMALAFLYPILAIMFQWLAGRAIDFGGWEVIAASPPQARIYVLVWLGSSMMFLLFAEASNSRWRWLWLVLTFGVVFAEVRYTGDFAGPETVSLAGAVGVASAEKRSRCSLVRQLLIFGCWITLLVLVIKLSNGLDSGQRNWRAFVIVTLGLLPLCNGLFDFASAGLTRYLSAWGLIKNGRLGGRC